MPSVSACVAVTTVNKFTPLFCHPNEALSIYFTPEFPDAKHTLYILPVKAALFDPTTILSLGLGKVLGFGATKAGGAVARSLMINAYKDGIKKGLTKTSAIKAIGESVKKAVPFAIADASLTPGVDLG